MARFVSQTLARGLSLSGITSRGIARPPPSRTIVLRQRSGRPEMGQLLVVDLGSGNDGGNVEAEVLTIRKLEEAIQGFFIEKAAPRWLPFVPGASYWVPPGNRGLGKLDRLDRQENKLTREEALSRTTGHGWPSMSFFVDGAMVQAQYPVKMLVPVTATSDDEE
ncbi:hypothetical protein HPP92_010552 [Vanilla planifolia]|uniref:Uncharacterized protein n=1 Tax=Vanilla planifolia TaxID=51239 RepID=A0A835V2L4_VANPL|nr:hypothetical protein HPP92_010792 [Vanilla planifolia]KAG0482468.1 hypothetical protein HPP92_010552 [Vanilla planifolia]